MDIWREQAEAVLRGLESLPEGLSTAEATRRRAVFGENRVAALPREPLAQRFARLAQFPDRDQRAP